MQPVYPFVETVPGCSWTTCRGGRRGAANVSNSPRVARVVICPRHPGGEPRVPHAPWWPHPGHRGEETTCKVARWPTWFWRCRDPTTVELLVTQALSV